MKLFGGLLILCMSLAVGTGTEETIQDNAAHPSAVPEEASFSDWGIGTIRDGFETVNAYLDYVSELLGGKNGVCQYRCRYGKLLFFHFYLALVSFQLVIAWANSNLYQLLNS